MSIPKATFGAPYGQYGDCCQRLPLPVGCKGIISLPHFACQTAHNTAMCVASAAYLANFCGSDLSIRDGYTKRDSRGGSKKPHHVRGRAVFLWVCGYGQSTLPKTLRNSIQTCNDKTCDLLVNRNTCVEEHKQEKNKKGEIDAHGGSLQVKPLGVHTCRAVVLARTAAVADATEVTPQRKGWLLLWGALIWAAIHDASCDALTWMQCILVYWRPNPSTLAVGFRAAVK